MRQTHKTIILWLVLVVMFYGIWTVVSTSRGERSQVSYSEFLDSIDDGRVCCLVIHGDHQFDWTKDNAKYTTTGLVTDGLIGALRAHKIDIQVVQEPVSRGSLS